MAQDLRQLSEKRKSWVNANRENGFEDGIKRLLTELYPDNAHFIYELLQNAEDAKATEVQFILKNDGVEFKHNGSRLFSIKDVDSITSIGVSAKRDDPTSIGKFGVGFKAVFVYTNTPEIHSGEFHFRIRDLVVPEEVFETKETKRYLLNKKETFFLFPFDNPKKTSDIALVEVERNLRGLSDNTLLFLSRIRKIEYILPDSSRGYLERFEKDGNRIEILVKHPEDKASSVPSRFFRFDKTVDVSDEDGVSKNCSIAVAFSAVENSESEKSDKRSRKAKTIKWKIEPLDHGQVSIFFPADKETSNLRFHIHAPFASTVARDSVRDCPANNELRDQISELVAESMKVIRDQGMLTVGFLATLPNPKDNLTAFYEPIREKLVETFKTEDLTPMKYGGHAAAEGIFNGQAQLSNLVDDKDIDVILGENYCSPFWVANPPQRNQREDNFLSSLDIHEWTIDELVKVLSSSSETIINWLSGKSEEWHQGLYALLGDFLLSAPIYPYYIAQNRQKQLASLRIVRLGNGTYNIGNKSFFPDADIENDELMPRVARCTYSSGKNEQQQKKARKFLEDIGVREVDEAVQIELILNRRYTDSATEKLTFKANIKDINRFIAFIEKQSERVSLFKDFYIFKLADGDWGKPDQVYLDSPFLDTGLNAFYKRLADKTDHWALSPNYKKYGLSADKIVKFAKALGAIYTLPIIKADCCRNPEWAHLSSGPGGYGNSENIDFTVAGLDKLLEAPSVELAHLLWHTMNNCAEKHLKAKYKKSDKSGFRHAASQLVYILRTASWVPQKNVGFVRPCDASSDQLLSGFGFSTEKEWLKEVNFGENVRKKSDEYILLNNHVQKLGFESTNEAKKMAQLLILLKQNSITPDEMIMQLKPIPDKSPQEFPTRMVLNAERRRERIAEQIASAKDKKYEERMRRVRTSGGTTDKAVWLKNNYSNNEGQIFCQICKEEMPFKKRDGEYYFESIEILSKDFFPKENEAQYLALCPLCSAMYYEFVRQDEEYMKIIKNTLLNSDKLEIPLKLGIISTSIKFVESHLFDIKTILNEMNKDFVQ